MAEAKISFGFLRRSRPRHWKDDVGNTHTSWGDVVITCSEHGELGNFPTARHFEEVYPQAHDTARLAGERHLREDHGQDV